jgi:hypothetical protein
MSLRLCQCERGCGRCAFANASVGVGACACTYASVGVGGVLLPVRAWVVAVCLGLC